MKSLNAGPVWVPPTFPLSDDVIARHPNVQPLATHGGLTPQPRGRIYRLQANRLLGLEARQIIDLPFRVLSPKKPVALTARLKRRRTDDFI